MASKHASRPRSTPPERPTSPTLAHFLSLLRQLHYPDAELERVRDNSAWLDSVEEAQDLLKWLERAFREPLEEVALEKEEVEMYETALKLNLVRDLPGQTRDEDLEPAALVLPPNYSSPAELITQIEQHLKSAESLNAHVQRRKLRRAQLASQVTRFPGDQTDSKTLTVGLDARIDDVRLRLEEVAGQFQTVESNSTNLLTSSQDLLPAINPLKDIIKAILLSSTQYTSLLTQLESLASPPSSASSSQNPTSSTELEEISQLLSQLSCERVTRTSEDLQQLEGKVEVDDLIGLGEKELEELLEREEGMLVNAEMGFARNLDRYSDKVKVGVKREVERAEREAMRIRTRRCRSDMQQLKDCITKELALLLTTHRSLTQLHTFISNLFNLSTLLQEVFEEASLSPLPLCSSASSTSTSSPPPSSQEIDPALLHSLRPLLKTPPSNSTREKESDREDWEEAFESVEDAYLERISVSQEVLQSDINLLSLLSSHLSLYSPTQILHPLPRKTEEILKRAKEKEEVAKSCLGADWAREVELNEREREGLKRLRELGRGRSEKIM